MEAEILGERLELAKLFLLGGGLNGEGLAFVVGGILAIRPWARTLGRQCGADLSLTTWVP